VVGLDATDVTTYVFRNGETSILALQRDFSPGDTARAVTLSFAQPTEVYDLRRQEPVGRGQIVSVTLDPIAPTILTIGPQL